MLATRLTVISKTLYINDTLTFCRCKTLSEVAFSLKLQSILTLFNGTFLYIPACKIPTKTLISVCNYVVVLDDLRFHPLSI